MKFKKSLQDRKFVVSLEIQPSIEKGIEGFIRRIAPYRGEIDALAVPELNPERVPIDNMGICRLLLEQQFEPILQMGCREKSRIDLQELLIKASESGINHILTFKEDYRISGDNLQETMFFHVDSAKFFSVIDNLKEGHDITGRAIQGKFTFCIGVGVDSSWGKEVPDLELKEMEEMAQRGIDYFLSTPVFDLDSFDQFMNRVRPIGVPVIAEIALGWSSETDHDLSQDVRSGTVSGDFVDRARRPLGREKTSLKRVTELVRGLKSICQGVHFISMGAEDWVLKSMEALKS